MSIIAPSILAADFTSLGAQVRAAADGGADWIHVDVMDGRFVPNISIGIPVVESLSKTDYCPPMDVHLMIENPENIIGAFARAGGDRINGITVQVEACKDASAALSHIRSLGLKAGLAFNPSTSVSRIRDVAQHADILLVMSVEPGFAGQSFIESSLGRIRDVREMLGPSSGDAPMIEVDGGITFENAEAVSRAGADALVSGSGIFGQPDIGAAVRKMKSLACGRTQ